MPHMDKHEHAAALDRIGKGQVMSHYNLKERTWRHWRVKGVPTLHHNTLRMLAAIKGVSVPELGEA